MTMHNFKYSFVKNYILFKESDYILIILFFTFEEHCF